MSVVSLLRPVINLSWERAAGLLAGDGRRRGCRGKKEGGREGRKERGRVGKVLQEERAEVQEDGK